MRSYLGQKILLSDFFAVGPERSLMDVLQLQRLLHRSNSCNTVFFSYIYLGKEYETAVIQEIRTMAGQTVPQIMFQYIYTYTSLLAVIWAYKSLRWKSTVLKTLHDHNSCSTRIVEITCRVTTKGNTIIVIKTH